MWENIKNYFSKGIPNCFLIFIIFIIVIVIGYEISCFVISEDETIKRILLSRIPIGNKGNYNSQDILQEIYCVNIIILTAIYVILAAILAGVAWFQLNHLNSTAKNDFLLRIDERFGGPEIVKARSIIHKFYCQTHKEGISNPKHIHLMQLEILNIKYNTLDAKDFMYLHNFIDFLETIAYFANRNVISETDVSELLSGSIAYYYHVFELFIKDRNDKYPNQSYYSEIKEFVEKIERNNSSSK